MYQTFALLAVGLLAGFLSGIFGIGGGLVIVPSLVFIFGYSQYTANGTSLVALLAPVGILGVLEYYWNGKIGPDNIKGGLIIAAGLFIGVYVGSKVAINLPEDLLRKCFAVFIFLVAIKLWFGK
jgi:uncharacterized protein